MYAIAGVTGNTGSVVASTLLARAAPVRALVRDPARAAPWRERGAEIAVADLADRAALTRALTGVAGAYLLIPPTTTSPSPLADSRALVETLAAAVAAARVPHVVLLSSIGAHHLDGTGPIQWLHTAEQALAPVTRLTALRAAYFVENWGASLGMLDQGVLPSFLPAARPMPMVATADIGRTAAAALIEGPAGEMPSVIELAGPRDLSPADVAATLGRLRGRPIEVREAPLDAVVPTFTSFGVSPAMAELYREMIGGIVSGRVAWQGGEARARRGSTTVEEVLAPMVKPDRG